MFHVPTQENQYFSTQSETEDSVTIHENRRILKKTQKLKEKEVNGQILFARSLKLAQNNSDGRADQ